MQHIIFNDATSYEVALLIKSTAFHKDKLEKAYTKPLKTLGVSSNIIGFDLLYQPNNKITVKFIKAYLEDLLPIIKEQGIKYLFVADSAYFKVLTNSRKADPHLGYVLPCAISGFEEFKVILGMNYQGEFYNPSVKDQNHRALLTLRDAVQGTYEPIGNDIIKSARYVRDENEVYTVLQELKQHKQLTCDVETLSLNFWETGIVTIAFAWNKHEGVTLWCDDYGQANTKVRQLLKDFFYTYTGVLIYHNANYDLKVIVNTLFMRHLLDEKGKQEGIEVVTRNFHDTKVIAYLALNSCAGNKLSLKDLAHEFAGNYALTDINDITKISKDLLEEYNLIDCLSTYYVFEKYFPKMIQDKQHQVYVDIFKPSIKVILQMELTGMPINMDNVKKARKQLEQDIQTNLGIIQSNTSIQQFTYLLQEEACRKANEKLKTKVKPLSDFAGVQFNPNSNPHMQTFLYEYLNFPVLDKTDSGAPAVGADTLKKLIKHTSNPRHKELIQACIDYLDAGKILGTFIKAFEKAVHKSNGHWYLHGNFNLGGTVSGRLSSSGPNLQNIPSTGNKYAKLVKKCFAAPKGWVFVGADFASLEDRISALTTKDPNKLKVYTDGYDGHCLRAYYYFKDDMPDINPDDVNSINSIKKKYPEHRQKSKTPTFALTYGGTHFAIHEQTGIPVEEAKQIEESYHEMYAHSDQWVQDKIEQASVDGFVTVAFGLRLRTPILHQCLLNNTKTPYEAKAEGRTAGNALGQSYGLLNNRAAIDLQERCFHSDYRYDILPVAHIHDAQYFLVRDNIDVVEWLNNNLVDCMQWQQLPDIAHPQVGLGGELSLFHPTWANEIELKNNSDQATIKQTIQSNL